MRVEIHRDGRWLECSSWRLQRSIHHAGGQLEAAGYHGGPIAPPWRVLDDDGTIVATDPGNTKRHHEGGASAVETDESPTTTAKTTAGSRTTP